MVVTKREYKQQNGKYTSMAEIAIKLILWKLVFEALKCFTKK
jgi:hypothetical protein